MSCTEHATGGSSCGHLAVLGAGAPCHMSGSGLQRLAPVRYLGGSSVTSTAQSVRHWLGIRAACNTDQATKSSRQHPQHDLRHCAKLQRMPSRRRQLLACPVYIARRSVKTTSKPQFTASWLCCAFLMGGVPAHDCTNSIGPPERRPCIPHNLSCYEPVPVNDQLFTCELAWGDDRVAWAKPAVHAAGGAPHGNIGAHNLACSSFGVQQAAARGRSLDLGGAQGVGLCSAIPWACCGRMEACPLAALQARTASTVLQCTVLHCCVLHCTVSHCCVLHCTVLHCCVLHCTVLQTLHCTALYRSACVCGLDQTAGQQAHCRADHHSKQRGCLGWHVRERCYPCCWGSGWAAAPQLVSNRGVDWNYSPSRWL
jgi:hypothetical protein